MRNSRRIKRMSRNRMKITKMNLTSLMDVFTILVFFLLVNSGSVEILEAPKTVKLPESRVESKPRETVVIFVSADEILVQGKLVALVADIINDGSPTIDTVTSRLAANPKFRPTVAKFVRRLEENLNAMDSCFEARDGAELAALAHWLKGSSGMVGFDAFSDPARDLEGFAKEQKWSEIEDCLGELRALTDRIALPSNDGETL